MPKKKNPGTALVPVTPPASYAIADTTIQPLQLYHVPDRHPGGNGPWRKEADKIAWVDAATELHCTILRARDGVLSGWVAVPLGHPLFGFSPDALPAGVSSSAHGGIEEAQACDDSGPEQTSVCHAHVDDGGLLWWFGFTCNKSYDHVPGTRAQPMAPENGQTYRSEGYVYRQCRALAGKLAAIGSGNSADGVPLDFSHSMPPIGLDPEER